MFILDSLMISGLRWALQTVATAADAEMDDAGALREQLLEAEMRREMGELSDDEFRRTEASVLSRIRELRERRDGGAGPLGFGTLTSDHPSTRIQVEASLTGDFHPPSPSPSDSAAARRRRDRPRGSLLAEANVSLPGRPPSGAAAQGADRSTTAAQSRTRTSRRTPSAGRPGKRRR